MPAKRKSIRTRSGFASRALVAALAVAGVGLIGYAAIAQDAVGPDGLPIVPDDGEFALPRICRCEPLYSCSTAPMICSGEAIKLCCPTMGCVFTTPGAPLPPGC